MSLEKLRQEVLSNLGYPPYWCGEIEISEESYKGLKIPSHEMKKRMEQHIGRIVIQYLNNNICSHLNVLK